MEDINKVIAKLVDGNPNDYENYIDDLHIEDYIDQVWKKFKQVITNLDSDDPDQEATKHSVALFYQDTYWNIFRGYMLTIFRIKAREENPTKPLFK